MADIHLDRPQRAKVGLQDILQALSGTDVDAESFSPPLRMVVSTSIGEPGTRALTLDSAFGLRSCAADMVTIEWETNWAVGSCERSGWWLRLD